MASGTAIGLQAERSGMILHSQPGLRIRCLVDLAFIRHDGIYRSDAVSKPKLIKPGAGVPPPVGRHPGPVEGRNGRSAPCSSSAMSSGRLFLDRVARQHCPSPLHRQSQINMHSLNVWNKGDILTLLGRGHFYFALTRRNMALTSVSSRYIVVATIGFESFQASGIRRSRDTVLSIQY
jgi:hypothetical protein